MLSNISALPTKIRAWAGTNRSGSSNTLDEDSDKYLGEVPKRAAKVAIIGSGWLGRALSTRLVEANYDVVIGTRNPHERINSKFDVQCNYMEVTAACQYGDIIILAIPHSAHSNLVPILALTARDKIVIDCSNRPPNDKYTNSVVEELQQNLPDCRLIKAFNDTSAHELSKDCTTGFDKTLCYCGNDNEAKKTVRHLLEHIGANSRDLGALRKARSLEALPFKFFSEWQSAMIVAIPTFIAIVMYTPRWYWDPVGNPYVFTKIFLKISGRYALVMFSFVYLAGIVAAIYQLVTGSSRKAFPRLLNGWLSIRKHLGLIALWMTIQHIIVSCFLAVPGNFIDVGLKGVSTSMNRWGEGSILLGVISFAVYLILGICSLPSVAAKMSWKEWNFVQSVIGYLGLATGGIHAFLILVTSLCNDRKLACQEFFPLNPGKALKSWPGQVPTLGWVVIGFPVITIGLKILLLLPPISCRLSAIRNGEQKGFICACASLRCRLGGYTTQEEAEEGSVDVVRSERDQK